jgi:isoamylase
VVTRSANSPYLWAEWNDRFRDTARSYWRGSSTLADLGWRLTGSADLYAPEGRRPFSSINFVTAHDGFTLRDLVSYEHKHNEANLEDNRDGNDNNISANYGVEGETDDPEINAVRHRQMRNFLTTCALSSGVPMISGGDEFGRTQHGNNNAYCQDNEISWYRLGLAAVAKRTCRLHGVGYPLPKAETQPFVGNTSSLMTQTTSERDVLWWHPDGRELQQHDWSDPDQRCLGMVVANQSGTEQSRRFLVAMNAHDHAVDFPTSRIFLVRRGLSFTPANQPPAAAHGVVHLPARSTAVLGTD